MAINCKFSEVLILTIGLFLFVSSLTQAEEKTAGLQTAFYDLGKESSVFHQVLEGLQGADPDNLLWNHADDIIVLDSSLIQKDGFEGIIPIIYFSLNQQVISSSIKFSTIGIGLSFYLNK
jgi:hypothetical protein